MEKGAKIVKISQLTPTFTQGQSNEPHEKKDIEEIQFSLNQVKSLIEGKLSSFQKFLEQNQNGTVIMTQQQFFDNTFASNKIVETQVNEILEICQYNTSGTEFAVQEKNNLLSAQTTNLQMLNTSTKKMTEFSTTYETDNFRDTNEQNIFAKQNEANQFTYPEDQQMQQTNLFYQNNLNQMNKPPFRSQFVGQNAMNDDEEEEDIEPNSLGGQQQSQYLQYFDDYDDIYYEDEYDPYNIPPLNISNNQNQLYNDNQIGGQNNRNYNQNQQYQQDQNHFRTPTNQYEQQQPQSQFYPRNSSSPQQGNQYLEPRPQIQQSNFQNPRNQQFNQGYSQTNTNRPYNQMSQLDENHNGYLNSFNYQQRRIPGQPLRNQLEQEQRLEIYRQFEAQHQVTIPKFFKSEFYLQKTPRSRFFQHLTMNEFYVVAQIYEKLGTQQQVAELLDTSVPNIKRILTTVKQQIESGMIQQTTPLTLLHQQIR